MPIIEGVGDEVVWFVSVVVGLLIALVAWWSTGYRQERMRTVVVMDRNVRHVYRAFLQHPVTFSIRRGQNTTRETVEVRSSSSSTPARDIPLRDPENTNASLAGNVEGENSGSLSRPTNEAENGNLASTEQISEMESIVSAMDSETSVVRNRRVAFFQQPQRHEQTTDLNSNTNNAPSVMEPVSETLPQRLTKMMTQQTSTISTENNGCNAEQLNELIEPNLNDSQKDTTDNSEPEAVQVEENETPRTGDSIRIRLKYLNDDQKLVEANLQEQLGDFKRRHFGQELTDRGGALVRLVFAGRLLKEADTLRDAGLYDNCVVHCLINQPRNQLNTGDGSAQNLSHNSGNTEGSRVPQADRTENRENGPNRDWDLGHALFTMFSMMLTFAWYCHFQYSHLFGAAASVALLILTALYGVAVAGNYSENHIRLIEVPPRQNVG